MTRDPVARAYDTQRYNAKKRGIPFYLTFSEWGQIWLDSGHFGDWGRQGHQYCMARFNDDGAYKVGNVKIITASENHAEIQFSDEARTRMTAALVKDTKTKNLGRVHSAESRSNMGQAQVQRWARTSRSANLFN